MTRQVPGGFTISTLAGALALVMSRKVEMFEKLLIANRGEIAVRVIRTAKEMGIKTIAVYSDADRDALHVRYADEAYALGGATPLESYLNIEKILDVIKSSGADAVHPGYGFFSENADFAAAVENAGVAFIGPSPEAITIMGDKISSRKAAIAAGVPGVPGTTEPASHPDEVRAFGDEHGWPVAIKAAYGGGGRGMRVVRTPEDADEALESARREALSAFGREECYLEKYLTWPRHIEMQIIGDKHGNLFWIGERDCSSQRRHQKLIEEAPAPNFNPEIREKMGQAAVAVARACSYVNAGTVEFLYQDGEFYFLEMNTRLQVEHPITEVTTGLDLVELQIRVAAGEKLPLSQDALKPRGSAIEVRINAEDPSAGRFLPTPGKITVFDRADGPGVRFDAGYESGDSVSQYYDNLIAKLTVWAPDRDRAIKRAIRALHETRIEGVATTIPADLAILSHPDFQAANHSTKWVEERLDLSAIPPATAASPADPIIEPTEVEAEVNGKKVTVKLYLPDYLPATGRAIAKTSKSGQQTPVARSAPASSRPSQPRTQAGGTSEVRVPMQGTVIKIPASVGQKIEAGEPVVILEAMKMENAILAERSGVVKEIKVSPGDSVGTGEVVAIIE